MTALTPGPAPKWRRIYYKLLGKSVVPCSDFFEWTRWFETFDRRVRSDTVGSLFVSTVFLGIDHRFVGDDDPLLFQTMIFGGGQDDYQVRTSTWGEAEAAHEEAVNVARSRVAIASTMIAG